MTSDEVASTGRPAWAISIWADNRSIYAEIGGQHGPYITAYTRDSRGMSQLVEILFRRHAEAASPVYIRPGVVAGYKPKGNYSEAQRERVRELLKKLDIT